MQRVRAKACTFWVATAVLSLSSYFQMVEANIISDGNTVSLDFNDVDPVNPLIITPPVILKGLCPYSKYFTPAAGVPSFKIDRAVLDGSNQAFLPKTNYLQQTINFNAVYPVFVALNASVGPLINRGEAHITVITPPEFEVLSAAPAKVNITEINNIATKANIQSSKFCITCVGRNDAQINGKWEQSYQIIAYSNDLIRIRQSIWELYVSRGGYPSRFNAANVFGAHITLGFTQQDLFDTNGVYKFQNACWGPISFIKT